MQERNHLVGVRILQARERFYVSLTVAVCTYIMRAEYVAVKTEV